MSTSEKFPSRWSPPSVLFYPVMAIILLLTQRLRSAGERVQAVRVPGSVAAPDRDRPLLYPAIVTVWQSPHGATRCRPAVRRPLDNYKTLFTNPQETTVLRNTLLWWSPDAALLDGIGLGTLSSSTAPASRSSPRR